MKNYKKLVVIPLSTILSFGILVPNIGAETLAQEQQERIQVRVASVESEVSKTDLINKVKALFPGKFDFLKDGDFEMSSGHQYPDDDTIRYDLSFFKEVKGKPVHGNFGFAGEDLQIEYFFYQPADAADALFPAKVSKDEAQKIAVDFMIQFAKKGDYQLDTSHDFYIENQTLVEPIRYSFSFVRSEKGIPIADQQMMVTVLGNGDVVDFFRSYPDNKGKTYDEAGKVLPKDQILAKVKENLSVQLQYQVDYDYRTGKPYVSLVYQPARGAGGVHALTGQWQTPDGFSAELPKDEGVKFLSPEPLKAKDSNFTKEKAKAAAEKILAVDSDKITLKIDAVEERENYKGQIVFSVQYMYETKRGEGFGGDLEFDKGTGEIVQYYNVRGDLLAETGEKSATGKKISKAEAKEKAVQYLKEYAPSYLHHYAESGEEGFYAGDGTYHFMFPRVVNGIPVMGDQISVGVAEDGSLLLLSVDQVNIETWPAVEKVISKEKAKAKFTDSLSLELRYMNGLPGQVQGQDQGEDNHYDLVYLPLYDGLNPSFIDAYTGEWHKMFQKGSSKTVSHSWAEQELNYLIKVGILEVEDAKAFNGNAVITKGEAIQVLIRSLSPSYELYSPEFQQKAGQTFANIGEDHPLYQVVERAVSMGILEGEGTFDEKAVITREELAVWYIRALGLEKAAQQEIYQLNFADKDKVEKENTGYVALASSYGLLTVNNQGNFNPDDKVTYAQLAKSIFRVAKEAYERQGGYK
ncbi:S-layer homology domain-containing protein [Bacillus benzoevorans]|uniref:SLH domain-containing protein n=1 Tax=Bacillus benzoevorans TaxID=1456 RepID=A0A7X0HTY0_9BACI|nr:S-layer homology domain-containing protein [Bacillus benzoevorans]MBB6446812.1 hypothetical protein [Bacillus benzoevorans]